jgi:hypothetical protein
VTPAWSGLPAVGTDLCWPDLPRRSTEASICMAAFERRLEERCGVVLPTDEGTGDLDADDREGI